LGFKQEENVGPEMKLESMERKMKKIAVVIV
jgi:hypothetical protein